MWYCNTDHWIEHILVRVENWSLFRMTHVMKVCSSFQLWESAPVFNPVYLQHWTVLGRDYCSCCELNGPSIWMAHATGEQLHLLFTGNFIFKNIKNINKITVIQQHFHFPCSDFVLPLSPTRLRPPPKWPILCRVGRYTLFTHSLACCMPNVKSSQPVSTVGVRCRSPHPNRPWQHVI